MLIPMLDLLLLLLPRELLLPVLPQLDLPPELSLESHEPLLPHFHGLPQGSPPPLQPLQELLLCSRYDRASWSSMSDKMDGVDAVLPFTPFNGGLRRGGMGTVNGEYGTLVNSPAPSSSISVFLGILNPRICPPSLENVL